jgi:hypothetical protein
VLRPPRDSFPRQERRWRGQIKIPFIESLPGVCGKPGLGQRPQM